MKKVVMSTHYSQTNNMIERKYISIINFFSKISDGRSTNKIYNFLQFSWKINPL